MAVYDTLVHRAHIFHLFSALSPLPPPESLSTLYMALLSHPTTNTDTQPGTVHRRVRTSMGESSRVVSFEPLLPHSAVSNSTAATAGNTGCSSRTGPTAARRNGTKGRAMINNGGLYALCSQKYQPWNRETRRTFLRANYAIFEGSPLFHSKSLSVVVGDKRILS